jgi:hypothetical protein
VVACSSVSSGRVAHSVYSVSSWWALQPVTGWQRGRFNCHGVGGQDFGRLFCVCAVSVYE